MKVLILMSILASLPILAQTINLTEQNLIEMARSSNPGLNDVEASFVATKVQAMELEDKFGYELYSAYGHQNTKEKSTIAFQPVFGNINTYQVGVRKYTKYGVVIDLNTNTMVQNGSSDSGSDYKDLHTTKYELGFQVDLWKDLMGKLTRSQYDNLQDMKKKDELQQGISKTVFEINIRRLYWSLVANAEKIRINSNLHKAAIVQLMDARKRRASSISDKAAVAKFESLVHQRKGAIIVLEYERESLLKNLRVSFPSLNGKTLKLGKYNINKSIFEVLACTTKIGKTMNVPFENTTYDEVVSILRDMKTRQLGVDKSYDKVDLKMDLKLSQIGVSSTSKDSGTTYSGDYGDSITDLQDNDRSALSAGLTLTIPFGQNKPATTKVKEKLTELQFDANIGNLDANVRSTHIMVKQSVELLTTLMKTQKANSKALAVRVVEMKKKYRQARIPEYALIQDQDSLLQSDVSVVDTQLLVVNTILDYLSVFNTFPCGFNRN